VAVEKLRLKFNLDGTKEINNTAGKSNIIEQKMEAIYKTL